MIRYSAKNTPITYLYQFISKFSNFIAIWSSSGGRHHVTRRGGPFRAETLWRRRRGERDLAVPRISRGFVSFLFFLKYCFSMIFCDFLNDFLRPLHEKLKFFGTFWSFWFCEFVVFFWVDSSSFSILELGFEVGNHNILIGICRWFLVMKMG